MRCSTLRIAGCAAILSAGLSAADWPQFRGRDGSGVAEERLPERWSATENVAWAREIPGRGWSSPIVYGGCVFVTSAVNSGKFKEPSTGIYGNEYVAELRAQGLPQDEVMRRARARDTEETGEAEEVRWMVYALDAATGRIVWEREAHRGKPFGGRHRKNTYASETPATDGHRLYVYFGNVGLFCYTLEGEPVWTKRWEPQPIYFDFGTASSPVVDGERVYVLNDNQSGSFLAAVDCNTGRELWRTARDFGSVTIRSGFSTPLVWRNSVRTEIVTFGPGTVISYGLDGRELWRAGGMSMLACPTPVASRNLLFVSSGAQGEEVRPLVAIRPGASGDITLAKDQESSAYVAWYHRLAGTYITSPLLYQDRVYVLYDNGLFAVFDAASGRQVYKARIGPDAHAFSSSPTAAAERIYCVSEDGDTYTIEAGDTFKLAARSSLGEMSLATPAAAGRALFLRTASKLYRIEER